MLAWSIDQARFLRERRFELLDIEHLADEIDDVGKSEQRELASRMAVLMAHLLKYQYQPDRKGSSWQNTIRTQRKAIKIHLKRVPSLKPKLTDPEWLEGVWADTLTLAITETGLDVFPDDCPWSFEQIIDDGFLPD
ncbi:MAG: DUF29 domain-containing protein [Candidatus Moranbacteria bacterium]|nr:DUF29 domain-containing protein [Candidatus Moranbacteria bacterium]